MRLHFTFWLFLFALNCFSMSKEFQEALSIFRDAIPSYSDIPNIDNSNIQYLITGKIYKIDEHAQICAPDEFRWNTSLNPLAKREVLGALVLQEKIYKCNLRPIVLSSLTKAGTKIKAAKMKIWRFKSTGLSSSPSVPSFEYSLLWVERGFDAPNPQEEFLERMARECPPDRLTLDDFKFLRDFMTKEIAQETFPE